MPHDVLILGGGVAGLACAAGLRESGLDVTLIEKLASLCGRACSFTDAQTGDRIDIGPHILLSEYPNLLALLRVLGTTDRVVWHEGELINLLGSHGVTRIHTHRLPPPLNLVPSMLKARDVSLRDKLSNARAVWFAMQLGERELMKFDGVPASEFLNRLKVSSRFVDWFWRSATQSLLNVPLEQCSAAALMRIFVQLIGHNDYRFGFPANGLDELFWPAARPMFETNHWPLRTHCAARALSPVGETGIEAALSDGSTVQATYCVSCLPPAELLRILPEHWRRSPELRQIERFQPSPYISVYHWFDRKLTPERFWAQVWNPAKLNCDFYDLSNIRPHWKSRGSVIASNIVHSVGLEAHSDEDISRRTLEEIATVAPGVRAARTLHRRVHRIPMAIPCPHPGTESIRPATATSMRGLLLAGDWTRTLLPASMESAARSGFLAAEHILAACGRPRSLAVLPRPTQGFAGIVRRLAHASPTGVPPE
jgi:uncharacterized protein with NAD-binding domain and iron-sulfur cluster